MSDLTWIGVDLDRTLAVYNEGDWKKGCNYIGEPVPAMVKIVRNLIEAGYTIKVFTARVQFPESYSEVETILAREAIKAWTLKHIGVALESTCVKTRHMLVLLDDRAVQIQRNTGKLCIWPIFAEYTGILDIIGVT